jgi:hypothetical protein
MADACSRYSFFSSRAWQTALKADWLRHTSGTVPEWSCTRSMQICLCHLWLKKWGYVTCRRHGALFLRIERCERPCRTPVHAFVTCRVAETITIIQHSYWRSFLPRNSVQRIESRLGMCACKWDILWDKWEAGRVTTNMALTHHPFYLHIRLTIYFMYDNVTL